MIGEILGNRYKLLRELGAGGMAWVYLAEDLLDSIQVAVKVLYPQYSRDMSYVERFVREAHVAQQIASEHVVRILNHGADRDVHYLVMEMIEGKDLSAVLRERGQLPWQEALRTTAQVAEALDAANAHGVVHRDIKPQNIMITPDGTVKVLDFGIARARALPSLTQTGFVGSPYYISPEQAMGDEVDVRSDIYSLGIALFEMLSGKLPFDAASPWSIISQHIAQEPPTLDLRDSGLPTRIEALVNRMLAKDPDDRFQNPGRLLQSIEAALQGKDTGELELEAALQVQRSIPLSKAHRLLLSSLYQRAVEAEEEQEWHQAVNLFNRIAKIDPHYEDVPDRLARCGRQARMGALYTAAKAAIRENRYQEAIDELSEIVSVDAHYLDAAELLTQAGMALAEVKTQQRIAELYEMGRAHYRNRDWVEAENYFSQVHESNPTYKDVASLYPDARRRARWASSLLGRVGHRLVNMVGTPEEQHSSETVPKEE